MEISAAFAVFEHIWLSPSWVRWRILKKVVARIIVYNMSVGSKQTFWVKWNFQSFDSFCKLFLRSLNIIHMQFCMYVFTAGFLN